MAPSAALGLLTLLLVVAGPMSAVSGHRTLVGGRTEVRDVKSNAVVQELGRFSVEEFNRRISHGGDRSGTLVFSQVVAAQSQVVAGIKYYLKIEVTHKGLARIFDSVVVVKPWVNTKELLDFAPAVN